MIRRLFLTWLVSGMCVQGFAQPDIMKIAPPSPTVASLGKYGMTPVNYYTGRANISIPIYEVKSGDLTLPISLSYATGGIKVEEMASWVGLGWSLTAGGVITRVVRGQRDEIGSGIMNPSAPTTRDIFNSRPIESWSNPFTKASGDTLWSAEYKQITRGIMLGQIDGEPDMFYYNFGQHSGQFYYNQDTQHFVSIPQSAIFFDKDYFVSTGKWHLIMEDGVEYYFDLTEANTNSTVCNGAGSSPTSIVTGWFLTSIVSKTSSITLTYDSVSYTRKNIATHTINRGLPVSTTGCVPAFEECNSINTYNGYKLSSISFAGGHVNFIANTNRCDLLGDKMLDRIEIFYDGQDSPIKNVEFGYSYFNEELLPAQGCGSEETSYNVRLKLTSLTERDSTGATITPQRFEYNESSAMPSVHSFRQDAWGYYNNGHSNTSLVPPSMPAGPGHPYYPGANRTVDTTLTSIGALERIYYPTGGYTEFEYENHKVAGYVPFSMSPLLTKGFAIIDTSTPCPGNNSSDTFCQVVTINDQRYGGAFVSIRVANMYCWDCTAVPPPTPTNCAFITLESATESFSIVCDVDFMFIPNGQYVLKADFSGSTDPLQFESFSVRLDWEQFEGAVSTSEVSLGGLRVKRITDWEGDEIKSQRYFKYLGYLSDRKFYFEYDLVEPDTDYPVYIRKSISNIPFGTTQGSPIGYAQVTVFSDEGGGQGKTVYEYSNAGTFGDVVANQYPYPDPISLEHRRGHLVKQSDFKWSGTDYKLVHTLQNDYRPLNVNYDWTDPDLVYTDSLYSETICVKAASQTACGEASQYPMVVFSKAISEWIRPVKSTERTYTDDGNYFEVVSETEYGSTKHLQPTKIIRVQSNGDTLVNYLRYPLDYAVGNSNDGGIKALQDSRKINVVVENYTTKKDVTGETVMGGFIVTHNDKLLPTKVFVIEHQSPFAINQFSPSYISATGVFEKDPNYKSRIQFSKFDYSNGNLLEQQKENDVVLSYLWGYNNLLPIAEVTGSGHSEIFHTSFEESGVSFIGGNGANQAFTGNKVLNSGTYSFPASFTPSFPANLVMTYWYWNGSQWVFSGEVPYAATINTGGTKLDEVRVYPSGAQMKTYTHKPGIGVTTVTDTNNVVQYFEYDSFGRLLAIRDSKGQLLQHYQYNYKTTQSSQ